MPNIMLEGIKVPFTEKVKVSITFNIHLSRKPQISELYRKIFSTNTSLRRLRNFLPIPTRVALAQAALLQILDYADCCSWLKEGAINLAWSSPKLLYKVHPWTTHKWPYTPNFLKNSSFSQFDFVRILMFFVFYIIYCLIHLPLHSPFPT